MKKNRMMRVASALLVAVLLTTCAISGTFAKYVTSDSSTDSARVAKWGVTAKIDGSLFGEHYNEYSTDVTSNKISANVTGSVDTSESDNIVAPGTESDKGLTLSVNGTPEVSYRIAYADITTGGFQNSEIWLAAGKYGVLVTVSNVTKDNCVGLYYLDGSAYVQATDKADFDANTSSAWYALHDVTEVTENKTGSSKYYPIEWTVENDIAGTSEKYRTVADIKNALSAEFTTDDPNTTEVEAVGANTATNIKYTISWKWAFEGQQDGADTILGNIQASKLVVKQTASGYTAVESADYSLTVAYGAMLTVTQVD